MQTENNHRSILMVLHRISVGEEDLMGEKLQGGKNQILLVNFPDTYNINKVISISLTGKWFNILYFSFGKWLLQFAMNCSVSSVDIVKNWKTFSWL